MFKKIIQWRAEISPEYYMRRIEKALGVKLKIWQKAYLLGCLDVVPTGRGIGKTMTVITRFILDYKAKPVDLRLTQRNLKDIKTELSADYDIKLVKNKWLVEEIEKYYHLLEKSGLKLREIKFPPGR